MSLMAWPNEPARVRVAQTPLKTFAGFEPKGFENDDLWIIPLIHRALTDQSCVHRFPEMPADHTGQIVYWEGAYYLITLALGWSNPAKGLKWWFDAGKPTEEPVLRLLKEVWDHRGQLERFAAWLWLQGQDKEAHQLRNLPGASQVYSWSDEVPDVDRAFGEMVKHRWSNGDFTSTLPYCPDGGSNELHLGHVFWMCENGELTGDLAFTGARSKCATIVIGSPSRWYYELCVLGERLPYLGEQSWMVDVLVKPWGWMGTYRRSRETGLWFLGKHSVHVRGN